MPELPLGGSSFSVEFAAIVFGTLASEASSPVEPLVVERFRMWLQSADRADAHAACGRIDAELIPRLGSAAMLEVARLLEARFPEVIDNMPNLRRNRDHLSRAEQLAQVFSGPSLSNLIVALTEEGARQ